VTVLVGHSVDVAETVLEWRDMKGIRWVWEWMCIGVGGGEEEDEGKRGRVKYGEYTA
jgi:hypothetical protein